MHLNSDFLLVRELEETSSPTRVVSPYGKHAQTPTRAEVLAMGPGYLLPNGERAPMLVKSVGEIVWLQFGAGTEVRINGEMLRMVPDRDLFCVEAA